MPDQAATRIAAAVVQRPDGRLLLLKRAPTHTTNPEKWCFVTGYVEPGEEPQAAAIRELGEELGISAGPLRAGQIVLVESERGRLHVYPFLFAIPDQEIVLEREHTDYRWIEAREVYDYDIVAQLDEDLISLGLLD